MNAPNRGPWIVTQSGVQFFLADPKAEDVRIEDIAAGLSRICRFGGQLSPSHRNSVYSVAQHSVYVDRLLARNDFTLARKWGLTHDATEAYYGDMISPLKSLFPEYSALEDRAAVEIRKALDVPYSDPVAMQVHWADKAVGMMESTVLSDFSDRMWSVAVLPIGMEELDANFYIWSPGEAYDRFLSTFGAMN